MKSSTTTFVVCALLLGAVAVAPAAAQTSGPTDGDLSWQQPQVNAAGQASGRPFRGLFGGPAPNRDGRSLVFNGSVFGAYDDNVLAGDNQRGAVTSSDELRGYYSGATAGLQFSQSGTDQTFALGAGVAGRYYPNFNRFSPVYHESAAYSTRLGRRIEFNASQQFLYTPNYRFSLFPGATSDDAPDEGIDADTQFDLYQRTAYRHSGSVAISRHLSQASQISADYAIRYVDFTDDAFNDFVYQTAGATYSRELTQHATMVLGYHYRHADYRAGGLPSPEVHNIDAGVNYSRSLSLTRRTTFGFTTGSTIVNSRTFEDGALTDRSRVRIRAIGSAHLERELGRTWTARLSYRRGLNFREGFDEPFYTDAASVGIGGLLSRRVQASASAGVAHSNLVSGGGRGYNAVTGQAGLQYAFTRVLAAYASYYYYQYRFRGDIALDPRLASAAHRNGVRVGLSVNVPLIR
jgi:hypothetical protein